MITTRGLPENVSTGGADTAWPFTDAGCAISNRTNIQQPIAERRRETWGFQSDPADICPDLKTKFINSTQIRIVVGHEYPVNIKHNGSINMQTTLRRIYYLLSSGSCTPCLIL